jgi:hypothetical protein
MTVLAHGLRLAPAHEFPQWSGNKCPGVGKPMVMIGHPLAPSVAYAGRLIVKDREDAG